MKDILYDIRYTQLGKPENTFTLTTFSSLVWNITDGPRWVYIDDDELMVADEINADFKRIKTWFHVSKDKGRVLQISTCNIKCQNNFFPSVSPSVSPSFNPSNAPSRIPTTTEPSYIPTLQRNLSFQIYIF